MVPRQGLPPRSRPGSWLRPLSPSASPVPGAHVGQALGLWSLMNSSPLLSGPGGASVDAQASPCSRCLARGLSEREQPKPLVLGSVLTQQSEQNATPCLPIVRYTTGHLWTQENVSCILQARPQRNLGFL